MKKFYTVFFDEIKFSNSPSLKDVLFVSLDQDSWLEIKNRKKLSSDDYDDVVNIFKPVKEIDGYTSYVKIAKSWLGRIIVKQQPLTYLC